MNQVLPFCIPYHSTTILQVLFVLFRKKSYFQLSTLYLLLAFPGAIYIYIYHSNLSFFFSFHNLDFGSVQLSSVTQSCLTLWDPMDCSTPVHPVHHRLPGLAQTHAHRVGDAIQPSPPLSSPFPPAFDLSQHQCLFKWISCLHQMTKVLEFQLQHQPFQWIFRTDFL